MRGYSIILRTAAFCLAILFVLSIAATAQQSDRPAQPSAAAQGQEVKPQSPTPPGSDMPLPAQPPAAPPAKSISDAWSGLLQSTIPNLPVGETVGVAQVPVEKRAAGNLLDHFFFETNTEYWRTNTYFTGQPTATGVINAPNTGTFNPNGIPDPAAFQPSSDEMYSFVHLGTHGWLSDRVNTDFSFRYRADLTRVATGAPEQDFLNAFADSHLFELLTGYVEINGLPSDGALAGTTLRLGRQDVYGAELAPLDGASFTASRRTYSYTIFGGRRFSYFSDPDQRAVGGVNFSYRFKDGSSVEYDGLVYITATQYLTYRRQLRSVLLNSHLKMVAGYPVDFVGNGIWTPPNGKTTVSVGFTQQITDKDYFYDYTINARDLDPHNPLLRLYLGPLSPYSQLIVDVRRTFNRRIDVGGGVWVRRLINQKNQGPVDTSFLDYHLNAQFIPWRDLSTYFEYHERDSDRLNPFPSSDFFDIGTAGETKIQDFTLELGKSFGEGRFTVRGGGYYRRMNFQDRFLFLNHLHDEGLLGRAQLKLDQRTRVYFDYTLDSDFFIFAPSIRNAQVLRFGMAWKY